MPKLIAAHTPAAVSPFPPYVNISREDDGTVVVTVRGNATERDGEYVCGTEHQRGHGGRCFPDGEHCNNYCNRAPHKGPMADAPLPFHYVDVGPTVSARFSAADWAELRAAIIAAE